MTNSTTDSNASKKSQSVDTSQGYVKAVDTTTDTAIEEIIFNSKLSDDEIVQAIAQLVNEAEKQGALNALTQLKFDRIEHTLTTPAQDWKREIDFIDEHIAQLSQTGGEAPKPNKQEKENVWVKFSYQCQWNQRVLNRCE